VSEPPEMDLATTRDLVEELLRTSFALQDVMTALLEDAPAAAFPDQDPALALLDMVIGSVHPASRAAGHHHCRVATALIGAIRERVLTDLRTAAESADRKTEK
jgi:hypothetical protein